MPTETSRPRGRPRQFDPDVAIDTARRLFHAKGYDAVSVADITQALGINPPSFYAAFGGKPALYKKVLERYSETHAIPFDEVLASGRPIEESLQALLEEAARRYAADAGAAGCLVMENIRCNDPQARDAALELHTEAIRLIRGRIAQEQPAKADLLTDFVTTTMAGLSASARNGHSLDRLLATARLASSALRSALVSEPPVRRKGR